jgi:hypothetical protein
MMMTSVELKNNINKDSTIRVRDLKTFETNFKKLKTKHRVFPTIRVFIIIVLLWTMATGRINRITTNWTEGPQNEQR